VNLATNQTPLSLVMVANLLLRTPMKHIAMFRMDTRQPPMNGNAQFVGFLGVSGKVRETQRLNSLMVLVVGPCGTIGMSKVFSGEINVRLIHVVPAVHVIQKVGTPQHPHKTKTVVMEIILVTRRVNF